MLPIPQYINFEDERDEWTKTKLRYVCNSAFAAVLHLTERSMQHISLHTLHYPISDFLKYLHCRERYIYRFLLIRKSSLSLRIKISKMLNFFY